MSTLHKPRPVGAKPRGWLRIENRRYRAVHRAEESQENHPHLLPTSASIEELDREHPHLAAVNRENWPRMGYKPTVPWKEFEKRKEGAGGSRQGDANAGKVRAV